MAVATSAAVLNGLGSPFLTGSKRSHTIPAPVIGGGAVTVPRRLVVVADVAPKKSWIPAVKGGRNLIDPEWLDGSLPGDFGFDSLGLGKNPTFLKWYREEELIHRQWAMAAILGIFVGQAWRGIPWLKLGGPKCHCSVFFREPVGDPTPANGLGLEDLADIPFPE